MLKRLISASAVVAAMVIGSHAPATANQWQNWSSTLQAESFGLMVPPPPLNHYERYRHRYIPYGRAFHVHPHDPYHRRRVYRRGHRKLYRLDRYDYDRRFGR